MADNTKFVVAGLAVAGLAFLWFREKPAKQEGAAPSQAPADNSILSGASSGPAQEVKRPENFAKQVQFAQAKSDVGLNQIGMRRDEMGRSYLHVRVNKKGVCHAGDYEALNMSFGPTGTFLLSLEPMDSDAKPKPIVQKLSLSQIFSEKGFSFTVDMKQKAVYGIYICGDSKQTNRCSQKRAVDFNQILNKQNLDVHRDGIFYYQFALLGGGDSRVYTGPDKRIANVREMNQKDEEGVKDIEGQLEKAGQTLREVRSYPPETRRTDEGWTLELQMSAFDQAACR